MTNDVLVLGAGVIGLTTAVSLAEAGHRVRVWAEYLPTESTSVAASGLCVPGWLPRELGWSKVSLAEFRKLLDVPEAGVHWERGLMVSNLWSGEEPPFWVDEMPEVKLVPQAELPEGMTIGAWSSAPMVDLPVYFEYLHKRLVAAGGTLERRTVSSLAEAAAETQILVNATGVYAGKLAGDEGVLPVRGQHVVVRNPGVDYFFMEGIEAEEWTAFFPHGDRVLLGGSSQMGNWSLEPDLDLADRILKRCAEFEPKFAGAEVLGHIVGLRAGREEARLEEVELDGTRVIHCYGHGSFGVSQSWGSAKDVLNLIG